MIEQFWGASKAYTRENCNYKIAGLRVQVPMSMLAVPLSTIRKFFRRQHRFCELYHFEGADPMLWVLRDFAMKKYSRHRGVPQTILLAIDEDLRANQAALAPRVTSGLVKAEKLTKVSATLDSLSAYHAALKEKLPERYLDTWWPYDSCP